MTKREPQIHTHITDTLPDDHPLAWVTLNCDQCGTSLHIGNESMDDWVETGKGNYCFGCFFALYQAWATDQGNTEPEDAWGLPEVEAR